MSAVLNPHDADQAQYEIAAQEAFNDKPVPDSLTSLGPTLLAEFEKAVQDRFLTEQRWLSDLRQYRGVYDPDVLNLIAGKRSTSFVRKTRVKVKTVDSRVVDLLFPAGSEKNWSVEPTPKPTISPEHRAKIQEQLSQRLGQAFQAAQAQIQAEAQAAAQQGQTAQPMAPQAMPQVTKEMVDQAADEFAKEAAKAMSSTIEDQLVECRYKEACIQAVHSGHLYGTGIIKGPLIEQKIRTRFVFEGNKWVSKIETYIVPFVDYVPLWRFYPDMGVAKLSDCRYVYERHQMTASDMATLASRKSFDGEVIKTYIKTHPSGEVRTRYVDDQLKLIGERTANQGKVLGQYEVLERWGWLTGAELSAASVEVPEERRHESFFSNIWLLPNGEVIKAVLQPINGVTWPYHMYSFDKDETSIFGEGIAAIMRDDQTMLNAAIRMMLDNAGITSGPMVEVFPHLLTRYDATEEIGPWKRWVRNSVNPGVPAVRPITLPSNLAELERMAQIFENNADETTAIPRYMSGENVANGAAGTAAGMSMLMGAANIVIKDLITSWDEGITTPFLQSLYRWNMQFNKDANIKGDFDVMARGAASLVAKEVRGRQLNEFAASTANEMDAPFIKRDKLLRQRAEANELSDVVKTEDEVAQEQANGPVAMQAQINQALLQAQLALAEANATKAANQAELIKAQAVLAAANTALAEAKAIDVKVTSVFAALQAGGTAVGSPHIAPAGDEILRSAGWKDDTPTPAISQLDQPAVQGNAMQAQQVQDLAPQTGHVGQAAGIETSRIE